MKENVLKDVNEGIQNLAKICSDLKDMEKNFSEVNELKQFFSTQIENLNVQIDQIKEKIDEFNKQYETEQDIHKDIMDMYCVIMEKYEYFKNMQESYDQKFQKYDKQIAALEKHMEEVLQEKSVSKVVIKKVVDTGDSELSAPSDEMTVEEDYFVESDEDIEEVDGINFLGKIQEANVVKVNNYKRDGDEGWNSSKELFGREPYAFIEEENLGLYKLQYPMQVEFTMKKLSKPKYLSGEIIRYYVNNVNFISMPKADKEVERVLFSKESGPKSLFKRVMHILSEASTKLLIDRNWNRTNTKKGNIPQSVIEYVENFDINKWRLCYALVKKESGKFHYTTWEVDFENETYLVTFGNNIVIEIIKKEAGVLPLSLTEVLDNPEDNYYKFVEGINSKLMEDI